MRAAFWRLLWGNCSPAIADGTMHENAMQMPSAATNFIVFTCASRVLACGAFEDASSQSSSGAALLGLLRFMQSGQILAPDLARARAVAAGPADQGMLGAFRGKFVALRATSPRRMIADAVRVSGPPISLRRQA